MTTKTRERLVLEVKHNELLSLVRGQEQIDEEKKGGRFKQYRVSSPYWSYWTLCKSLRAVLASMETMRLNGQGEISDHPQLFEEDSWRHKITIDRLVLGEWVSMLDVDEQDAKTKEAIRKQADKCKMPAGAKHLHGISYSKQQVEQALFEGPNAEREVHYAKAYDVQPWEVTEDVGN